jgi:hypothetical protein
MTSPALAGAPPSQVRKHNEELEIEQASNN